MKLAIQRIVTNWTRDSRGGKKASARNETPEALPLPITSEVGHDVLLHDVRYREGQDFKYSSTCVESDFESLIRMEPLYIYTSADSVKLRFVWTRVECGAPERECFNLFELGSGQWGRFICNGRFGDDCMWHYHKTVFNIALTKKINDIVFISTPPSKYSESIFHLK